METKSLDLIKRYTDNNLLTDTITARSNDEEKVETKFALHFSENNTEDLIIINDEEKRNIQSIIKELNYDKLTKVFIILI